MKKIISLLLCGALFFSMVACSTPTDVTSTESESEDSSNVVQYESFIRGSGLRDNAYSTAVANGGVLKQLSTLPEYQDNGDRMFIYTFQEPRPQYKALDEACKNIADCNFNSCMTWGYKAEYTPLLEKYGVAVMPYIDGANPQTLSGDLSPENISDNIKGFYYKDEPSFEEMYTIVKPCAVNHATYYNDKLFFVNLNPYWEGNETNENSFHKGYTYDEYVAEFCGQAFGYIERNRILSVDFYPLMQDGTQRNVWLYTYETLAKYAQECDATFHFYVMATEHYGYRRLDMSNLRYMVNVGLTYGASAMSYFTYLSYEDQTAFEHGLVSPDGLTKYDSYYMAQTMNAECLAWDHIFMNFKWQSTMFVEGKDEKNLNQQFLKAQVNVESIEIINSVTATRDTIVGEFLGSNDEVGLMVTNFCDPVGKVTDKVTLNLKEANKAILYYRGERSVVDIQNGILELSITPGDAIFVIPLEVA